MLNETLLYDLFGVQRDVSSQELTKAFKKMAMKYHPDRNPNEVERFKHISMAYACLTDPEKRRSYDEGIRISDMIKDFATKKGVAARFTANMRSRRRERVTEIVLNVTLEELYNGAIRHLTVQKNVICDKCNGRGGLKQGETIAAENRCEQCNGEKTVRGQSVLEVHIEKGMQHGQEIFYSGQGNQSPDRRAGDIVVLLNEEEHPVFQRSKKNGSNLFVTLSLTLTESVCGFQKIVKTLDNRFLRLSHPPRVLPCEPDCEPDIEVVRSGDMKCVTDEGMPQYKNPVKKGLLIITFEVIFPTSIDPEVIPRLKECLSGTNSS